MKKVAKVDRKILLRVVHSWLILKCVTRREFDAARMGIRVKLNGALTFRIKTLCRTTLEQNGVLILTVVNSIDGEATVV